MPRRLYRSSGKHKFNSCQRPRELRIVLIFTPETNHSGGRYSVLYQSANSLVERERSFSTSLKIRSIFFCSIRITFPEAMS